MIAVIGSRAVFAADRELSGAQTAGVIAAIGFAVGLVGDACHVASGTTAYEWEDVPSIWRSAIWFPVLVSVAVLSAAWAGEQLAGKPARMRGRADAVTGIAAVLALYALTAVVRDQPDTVSVVLIVALAVVIWSWWDPSPGALAVAVGAAVLGPLAEIVIVEVEAAHYAESADSLGGVAPWLTGLYFAAGAVGSRLWGAIARDGQPPAPAP
jgi:hypothetical protein